MAEIVVLDAGTIGLPEEEWGVIEKLGETVRHDQTPHDPHVIVERCRGAEIVLSNKVPLRGEVLRQLPDLRLITTLATGVNHLDLDAAEELGVTICNASGYSTPATAQHTVALILELCNKVWLHGESVNRGEWMQSPHFCYTLGEIVELRDKEVGIVGFGSIGRRVGEVMHAMGARIAASMRNPRNPPEYEGFRFAETAEIFAECDVVTLHCPQTEENEAFVNKDLLATMKPGAFLVNTARGALINEPDLADALRSGKPAGAALDVISAEPMKPDNPLRGVPNLIMTPHIAWASRDSFRRLLATNAGNIEAFRAGEPRNVLVRGTR